ELSIQVAEERYLLIETAHICVVWSARLSEHDGYLEGYALILVWLQSMFSCGWLIVLCEPLLSLFFGLREMPKLRLGHRDLVHLTDRDIQLEDLSSLVAQKQISKGASGDELQRLRA